MERFSCFPGPDDEETAPRSGRMRFVRLSSGERVLRIVGRPRQLEFPFVLDLPRVQRWSDFWTDERPVSWWMRMFNDDCHPLSSERRSAFLAFLSLEQARERGLRVWEEHWRLTEAPDFRAVLSCWLAGPDYRRQSSLLREAFFDRIGRFPRAVVVAPLDSSSTRGIPNRPLYFRDLGVFIQEWADRSGEAPPPGISLLEWVAKLEDVLMPYFDGALPREELTRAAPR